MGTEIFRWLKKLICNQPIAFYKIRMPRVRYAREHTFKEEIREWTTEA